MQQSYHQPQLQHSYQVPAVQQPTTYQPPQQLFPQLDSGLVVPSFNTSDDPVVNLNKAVAFLTSYASHFSPTNNQLRTSSNPRNQATIQDGRVTVQTVQGRQNQGNVNTRLRNNVATQERQGQAQVRMIKCYNCQEDGHMARECTKPKRPKNSAWFREKLLLTEALESGACLDPEQLAFLADNGDAVIPAQATPEVQTLTAFQTDDLDAYDSDCDEAPSAQAVLMANLSSYDSAVISEVPNPDTHNGTDISNQSVQVTECYEQPSTLNNPNTNINNDSNIVSYEQYLQETDVQVVHGTSPNVQQDEILMSVINEMTSQVAIYNKVQQENRIVNETLTAELERYKEQIKIFEQRQKFDLTDKEKYIDGQLRQVIVDRNAKVANFEKHIHLLQQQLNATVETHKTALGYQNPFYLAQARRKVPALYDGHTIVKSHDALIVPNSEETLKLVEESRLKMHAKQNDPDVIEKKVNTKLVDYVALNKLSEHFETHFVPQKQLSAEQAFWLAVSKPVSKPISETPLILSKPVVTEEIPRELPRISLVKDSFNKMRDHVNKFDETITYHTNITGVRIGNWGVDHIKEAFENDVKPFAQLLKEYFQQFDYGLNKEIKEMRAVFNQMETEVAKCSVDKRCFDIEKKGLTLECERLLEHIIYQDVKNIMMHANHKNVSSMHNNSLDCDNTAMETLKMENDRLMELLISQDIVHTHVNSLAAIKDLNSMQQSFVDEYEENLKLHDELAKKNDFVEKLFIMNFQKDVQELNNVLQAQLEAKELSIKKLQEHIANLKGKNVVECAQNVNNSNVIVSNVYKLDLDPLPPQLRQNKDAHVDYLDKMKEHTDTLRGIVEQAKKQYPGVKRSTKDCGSKPRSNTKNDRIPQPSCSNSKKNKSVLNVNSELMCTTCNECMFDSVNDSCVRAYLNDVVDSVKIKSVNAKSAKSKSKKVWKSTGKVFTNVGYRWIPTGRKFTIDGNTCPLTRITSTNAMPPKKQTPTPVVKTSNPASSKSGIPQDKTKAGSIINLLKDLGVEGMLPVPSYCDNTFAIQIAANPVFHEKIKHFEIDMHLVREKVASGVISTVKIDSARNVVDVFTKGLSISQHKQFCLQLNLVNMFEV
ncbi:integrase, catalytic region, zinc finger, CCHC-type containing protein [Tanacetum coccineum]